MVLPNLGPIIPAFALIVFDGGMISWLVVYLNYAEGGGQRGTAAALTVFDLVGVGLMAFAEIFLGGQTLAKAPEYLGEVALWGIGIWTVTNVAGVVLFHLLSPSARRDMALRDAQDTIQDKAFEQLKAKTEEMATRVAEGLSDNMVNDALRAINAQTQNKPPRTNLLAAPYSEPSRGTSAAPSGASVLPAAAFADDAPEQPTLAPVNEAVEDIMRRAMSGDDIPTSEQPAAKRRGRPASPKGG